MATLKWTGCRMPSVAVGSNMQLVANEIGQQLQISDPPTAKKATCKRRNLNNPPRHYPHENKTALPPGGTSSKPCGSASFSNIRAIAWKGPRGAGLGWKSGEEGFHESLLNGSFNGPFKGSTGGWELTVYGTGESVRLGLCLGLPGLAPKTLNNPI